jgi:hypothetical protein
MAVLLVNGFERDRAENRDPFFAVRTLKSVAAQRAKKEARPMDRANLTRCAAIYSENAKKQWVVCGLVS